MSDPLIVHWPKGIAARGEVRGQYVHVVDIAPTILEALGARAAGGAERRRAAPLEGVSFAHTLDDADCADARSMQYYEMIGSRALWADGWKAVVEQPQGEMLTDEMLAAQKWELYHVAEDFSECEDLADEASGEARRAGRAVVDRGGQVQRAAARFAHAAADGRAQAGTIRPAIATSTTRTARRIRVHGGQPEEPLAHDHRRGRDSAEGAEGVLLAHGSWFAGLFALCEGSTAATCTTIWGSRSTGSASTEELPAEGVAALPLHEDRRASRWWHAVWRRAPDRRRRDPAYGAGGDRTSGEGLCCGYDSGLPVTPDYHAPFRFTGELERVVVEVGEESLPDAEAHVRAAFIDH